MYISYQKLDKAGYDVKPNKNGVDIHPRDHLDLPFDELRDLLQPGLSQHEVDVGLDAFVTEVEMVQIMKAIR